jgi:acetyl-CoA carboxylase carboxyltransferase component
MSARGAVKVTGRERLRSAHDPDAELARMESEYAREHLLAEAAAASGFVDEIVEPADTRQRLASALDTLAGGGNH